MNLNIPKTKATIIQIRVTTEEREEIKKEAAKRGFTVTELIKVALNEYCK